MKKTEAFKFEFESAKVLRMPSTVESKIYAKIDWLSVVFNDHSLNDVLDFLGLVDCVEEFFKDNAIINQGYEDFILFRHEGINLQANNTYFYAYDNVDDVFDLVVPKIRLDITGTGLDYLRSRGLKVEEYFREYSNYPQPFHLTRCDFAFDLINYAGTLIDEVIDHCRKWHTETDRICIYKMHTGYKYKIVEGGQKTVYIGATTSERMLRIYDKRLQYIDPHTGYYKKDNEYGDPVSWIRLELQTRRMTAMKLCFDGSPMESILKYLYEQYCFADVANTNENNRKPAAFWQNLFNWELIPSIIQNFDKVQYVAADARAVAAFLRVIDVFRKAYSILGDEGFRKLNEEYDNYINDISNPNSRKKRTRIINQLNECGIEINQFNLGYYEGNPFGSYKYLTFRMKGWN